MAISVRPAAAARGGHITTRLRSAAALSAFLNPLFFSLLALRPRIGLGGVAAGLAIAGLVSMLILLLLVAQGRDRPWPPARGLALVVGQAVLYTVRLHDGIALESDPSDVAQVDSLAVIVILLFALGLARAREFVGADDPTLLGALARVTAASRGSVGPTGSSEGAAPSDASEPGRRA